MTPSTMGGRNNKSKAYTNRFAIRELRSLPDSKWSVKRPVRDTQGGSQESVVRAVVSTRSVWRPVGIDVLERGGRHQRDPDRVLVWGDGTAERRRVYDEDGAGGGFFGGVERRVETNARRAVGGEAASLHRIEGVCVGEGVESKHGTKKTEAREETASRCCNL